jgi:hypothetical protein
MGAGDCKVRFLVATLLPSDDLGCALDLGGDHVYVDGAIVFRGALAHGSAFILAGAVHQ